MAAPSAGSVAARSRDVSRPIVFLTDYGGEDEFAGVCRAVIAGIAPEARVLDLTHGIPPQDVVRGAVALADAAPFLPEGSVVLAVVDPGVGTSRRAVAVEAANGAVLVGPDNGLLAPAWEALGGAVRAVAVENQDLMLQPVSATFHGRDVFAPAAARLATGLALTDLGPEVSVESLARLELPPAESGPDGVRCVVRTVDRFGNVQLSATPEDLHPAGLSEALLLEVATDEISVLARSVRAFADGAPGELVMLTDSTGRLAVAVTGSSAAAVLGTRAGDEVTVRGAPNPGRR
jgi:S-adenosylmethionine hydrolase